MPFPLGSGMLPARLVGDSTLILIPLIIQIALNRGLIGDGLQDLDGAGHEKEGDKEREVSQPQLGTPGIGQCKEGKRDSEEEKTHGKQTKSSMTEKPAGSRPLGPASETREKGPALPMPTFYFDG